MMLNIETASVPGAVDQVDLAISVKERATGNFMFGAGYADSDGLFLVAEVHRANLFGTGRELSLEFEVSKIDQVFDIEYRNPYHTAEGVSRAFFLNREQIDTESATTADYSSRNHRCRDSLQNSHVGIQRVESSALHSSRSTLKRTPTHHLNTCRS